jgi:hypothetical protein
MIMHAVQLEGIKTILVGSRRLAEKAVDAKPPIVWKPGLVLIRAGAAVPESSELIESTVHDWNGMAFPAPEFEEWLRGTDWQWSYYTPSLTQTAWGVTPDHAIRRAAQAAVVQAEKKGLNSVEVESTVIRGASGLYRATVKLGVRNLQQGPFLKELGPRHRVAHTGHQRGLTAVANRKGLQIKAM